MSYRLRGLSRACRSPILWVATDLQAFGGAADLQAFGGLQVSSPFGGATDLQAFGGCRLPALHGGYIPHGLWGECCRSPCQCMPTCHLEASMPSSPLAFMPSCLHVCMLHPCPLELWSPNVISSPHAFRNSMHSPSMPSGNPCLQEIHALINPCWAQPLLGSALVGLSPCWAQPLNPFRAHSPRQFHSMIKTMAPKPHHAKPSPQLALGDAAHLPSNLSLTMV